MLDDVKIKTRLSRFDDAIWILPGAAGRIVMVCDRSALIVKLTLGAARPAKTAPVE
jgi:hypothetical protein